MLDDLGKLHQEALSELGEANDEDTIRELEVKYLGKKGALTALMKGMGKVSPELRPQVGQKANWNLKWQQTRGLTFHGILM